MPVKKLKIKLLKDTLLSVDTETTGADFYHKARPFFITTCGEDGQQVFWEFDVNPFTREVIAPQEDIDEVVSLIKKYAKTKRHKLVLQNTKFDVTALSKLSPKFKEIWPWDKTEDTLISGHLLASNQPHDLTTMALVYLRVNIEPLEEALYQAVNECRKIVRKKAFIEAHGRWAWAEEGLEGFPSAKGENLKNHDYWMPKALVKEVVKSLDFDILPEEDHLPKIGRISAKTAQSKHFVRIDRQTKWGNPYVIGKDGTREDVIKKYAVYILEGEGKHLLADLHELHNKVLGCHCAPELCHGQVLRALCHSWFTVLRDYGNADSAVTVQLYKAHKKQIQERKLTKIYRERLNLLRTSFLIEQRGITVNKNRRMELKELFTQGQEKAKAICVGIAKKKKYELDLPKGSNNNSLKNFVFSKQGLNLEPVAWTAGGEKSAPQPSFDKKAIDHYLATLDHTSVEFQFINALKAHRQRGTSLGYMDAYEKFWIPTGIYEKGSSRQLWFRLHPSLLATGTVTLRWSSQNPNSQQISKKEIIEAGDEHGKNNRYIFGPAPGREWWSRDASNIELRIPAFEANEPEMVHLFSSPDEPPYYGGYHLLVFDTLHPEKFKKHGVKSKDVFADTWYQWTKNGNFAVQYGAQESSGTADAAYHVPGAQKIIMGRFTNIKRLSNQWLSHANKFGYVETMPDKTVDPDRGYPLLCSRTRNGGVLPTVPLSYHVQGTAMWWMAKAMGRVQAFFDELNHKVLLSGKSLEKYGYFIIAQVHDEMLFDFPKGEGTKPWLTNKGIIDEVGRLMEKGGDDLGIPTPTSCKYHPNNWAEGISV